MAVRPRSICPWAALALAGIAVNLVVLVLMPVLRPDLDLLVHPPSFYAIGPWAALQWFAFAAMGVASLALAAGLWPSAHGSPWLVACAALLVVASVSSIGLVWFPMDRPGWHTPIGDMHQTSGTIGGVAHLVAALCFLCATRSRSALTGLYPLTMTAFIVAVSSAIISQIAIWRPDLGLPMGVTMRLVVLPLLVLWGVVAWRLRHACDARVIR